MIFGSWPQQNSIMMQNYSIISNTIKESVERTTLVVRCGCRGSGAVLIGMWGLRSCKVGGTLTQIKTGGREGSRQQ